MHFTVSCDSVGEEEAKKLTERERERERREDRIDECDYVLCKSLQSGINHAHRLEEEKSSVRKKEMQCTNSSTQVNL